MIINYYLFLVNLLIIDSINKYFVRILFLGLGECKYINILLVVKFDGKLSVLFILLIFLVIIVIIF